MKRTLCALAIAAFGLVAACKSGADAKPGTEPAAAPATEKAAATENPAAAPAEPAAQPAAAPAEPAAQPAAAPAEPAAQPAAAPAEPAAAAGDPLAAPADVAAPPADAQRTPSGLAYKSLKPATGEQKPLATDTVQVHYTGWTTDGKMFDSSVKRGEPAVFPLNRVIPGWTEGLQLMRVGETMRFWIPAELAYGEKPMRPGAPAGMLVFDVELIAIR